MFASKKRTSGGATTQYFYENDHLGGVNVITDINGAQAQLDEYDPWGAVSKSVGDIDQTHRFTGQELDPESGLYYYGGRYYDQEISRFVSPDPFVQSPDDPQNLNRYSYVLNNPQNYVDPTGYEGDDFGFCLFCFWDWFGSSGDDDKPKPRPKPKHRAASTPHHELEVENGGLRKLQNVLVYDSQGSGGSQDPNQGTGNAGNDYPGSGFGGLRLTLVQASGGGTPPPYCTAGQSLGKQWIVSGNATTSAPTVAGGAAIGWAVGNVPGAIIGAIIGSFVGIGGNVSNVPSTGSWYVGPTIVVAPLTLFGGSGANASAMMVPPTQNPNSIANELSFSVTFQYGELLGSTLTKSPGSGPAVVGPSVGTRVPLSGGVSYNFCVKNCGCSR